MTPFQQKARELAGSFAVGTRGNGEEFFRLRDDAPEWAQAVPRAAHCAVDGRFPCDWLYRLAAHAADWAAGFDSAQDACEAAGEFADGATDIYTDALYRWASIPANRALCDLAAEEFGGGPATIDTFAVETFFRSGQHYAAELVARAVVHAIFDATPEE